MIFKLTFEDGRIDWCTAKDQLHLLKSYDAEFELPLQELESIVEISDEDAKTIRVRNSDYDEDYPDDEQEYFYLSDIAEGGERFAIIASTEFE